METVQRLVCSHSEWIKKKATYMTNNEDEAEDLAGETIYKCLRNADRYDTYYDFKPWVTTIMKRIRKDQLERKRYIVVPYEQCRELKDITETSSLAEFNRIVRIIKQLRKHHKNVDAALMYAMGFSYSEISRKMKVSIGTVCSRVYNGKQIISKALKEF